MYEKLFLNALLITLITEIPVVFIFYHYVYKKIRDWNTVFVATIASTLTLPYLWFILPLYVPYGLTYLVVGELIVILVEAIIYWRLLKLSFKQALIISLVANILSIFIGKFIM